MVRFGSRKGLSHVRACCERYEAWLRSQVVDDVGEEMVVQAPPAQVPPVQEVVEQEARAPSVVHDALSALDAEGEQSVDDSVGDSVQVSPAKKPRTDGQEKSATVSADVESKEAHVFTRGCPACESGMDVPGIRHNAACKRRQKVRFQELEVAEVGPVVQSESSQNTASSSVSQVPIATQVDDDEDMPMSEGVETEPVMHAGNTKRSSEIPVDELEREIRHGVEGCMMAVRNCETGNDIFMLLASFVEQVFQVTEHVPLLSGLLDSVQFAPNATSVVLPFGKRSHLRVWRPRSAVDDSTLSELPGDEVMEGMLKEVNNLSHMETGDLLTASELQALEKKFPGTLKVIPSRWVTTRKTPTTVRARIVIKDIAGKSSESARSLGISSPTPRKTHESRS